MSGETQKGIRKLISQNSELFRALKNKSISSKSFASSYQNEQPSNTPKISKQDEMSYARAGFIYDTKQKIWKKKLPNGKFLVKNTQIKDKNKQTYILA